MGLSKILVSTGPVGIPVWPGRWRVAISNLSLPVFPVAAGAGRRIAAPVAVSRAVVEAGWTAAVPATVSSGDGGVGAPHRPILSVSGGLCMPRLVAVAFVLEPTPAVAHPRPAVFPLEGVHGKMLCVNKILLQKNLNCYPIKSDREAETSSEHSGTFICKNKEFKYKL